MAHKVFVTFFFEKKLKNLRRKYPRIFQDYKELLEELEKNPYVGDRLRGCAGPIFKIRMASMDMGRGKSGGFRIIYWVQKKEKIIYLLTLYPKSERENIEVSEVNEILSKTGLS